MAAHTLRTTCIAAGALALGAAANAAVTDNLQGYYRLDETSGAPGTVVANQVAGGENGTITSMTAVNQPAVLGSGYTFDQDGATNVDADYTDSANLGKAIVDSATLEATDKASVALWVNPSALRAGTGASSRSSLLATNSDLSFSIYAGGSLFFNYKGGLQTDSGTNSSGTNNLAGGMGVPLNQWSHVAATRDGTTVRLFINGIMVAENTTAQAGNFYQRDFIDTNGDTTADDAELYLGTISGSAIRDYSGQMDEVGIWVGRALSPKEMAAVAGLSRLAGVGLDSAAVDQVVAVFDAQAGSAAAGAYSWEYSAALAAPVDASTQYLGKHYLGADGKPYIILGGSSGAWTGVVGVPEPGAAGALLGLGALLGFRRQRRG